MCQVHHIDPTGQDAGVVYCEMQGRENKSSDLMSLQSVSTFTIDVSFTIYPLDLRDRFLLQVVVIEANLEGLWMLYVY